MKFSTNAPTNCFDGLQQMNVSKEADRAFIQELKRSDPRRYARLVQNMQKVHYAAEAAQDKPRCRHCGLVLSSDARKDAKYCDAACKKARQRSIALKPPQTALAA